MVSCCVKTQEIKVGFSTGFETSHTLCVILLIHWLNSCLKKKNWTLWLFDCCDLSICHCLWWKMLPLFLFIVDCCFCKLYNLVFLSYFQPLLFVHAAFVYIYYHCFLLTNFIVNEIHCQNKLCEKSFNCEGAINAVCAVTLHTQR